MAGKTPITVGLNQARILLGTDALNIYYEDNFGKHQEKKYREVVRWMEMASRDNRYLTFQGGCNTHCHQPSIHGQHHHPLRGPKQLR